jgi:hypothetical protein
VLTIVVGQSAQTSLASAAEPISEVEQELFFCCYDHMSMR